VVTEADIQKETRRAVLTGYAKKLGIGAQLQPKDTIGTIKGKIMAVIAPVRTQAKPAPKPPAAPAKAAPPPVKAAPAKLAPPVTPKAAPAPAKAAPTKPAPVAAAPVKAPLAAESYVTKAEFAEFAEQVQGAIEAISAAVSRLDVIASGFDPRFVTTDEGGAIVLNIAEADEETLRDWSYQFAIGDHTGDVETLRKAFTKSRAAKGFTGWEVKNDLPRPVATAESMGNLEPEPEAEAAAEEGEEEISLEQIESMNWDALTTLANNMGLDYKDLGKTPQPKVLRGRIITVLTEANAEAPAEETGNGHLEAGTSVMFENEGTTYSGHFVGLDDDNDAIVGDIDPPIEGQEQVAIPMDMLTIVQQ
jgi:hypothetical protein